MSPAKLIAMFLRRLFSMERRTDYNEITQDEPGDRQKTCGEARTSETCRVVRESMLRPANRMRRGNIRQLTARVKPLLPGVCANANASDPGLQFVTSSAPGAARELPRAAPWCAPRAHRKQAGTSEGACAGVRGRTTGATRPARIRQTT